MGKRGRKPKPPKIIIPKKKISGTLAHKIRKQQDNELDKIADSAVKYVKGMMENHIPFLAFYTVTEAALMIGVSKDTLKKLIKDGVVPEGEVAPSGYMFFQPVQVKLLDMAAKKYIFKTSDGATKINREGMKQFVKRYWPKEVYDERKGRWTVRQAGYSDGDSFQSDYGRV